MRQLSIDIETYSSVDLRRAGVHKYAESPDFEILLFGYAFNDDPVQIIDVASGESIPEAVWQALNDPNTIKHAYNAQFERVCLSKYVDTPASQWQCTMVHGLYLGLPAGLALLGEALGLPQEKQKSRTGAALIRTFCVPCRPTKSNNMRKRTLPQHEPEKWDLFKEYCVQDVETEREIANRLQNFPVPKTEQQLWQVDQAINDKGVMVDEEFVRSAIYLDRKVTTDLMTEARELTGLKNPRSVQQLKGWLETELKQEVPNLQKATVAEMLDEGTPKNVQRALEIRQKLGKTSTSKYVAMKDTIGKDSRVRGLLQFYGANRTGRWAGRLVQVQNLPRNYLPALDIARQCTKERKIEHLKVIYGNIPSTLSQLIRTAFVPKKNSLFLVADFSAIEARVIAWLANETWRQKVFATHGKIYEASASAMFDVPIEQITKGSDLRQKGKVAELALGYQGGPGALISMGALNMGLTEEELPEIVQRWRNANKSIVSFWYALENAALNVVRTGQAQQVRGLTLAREGDAVNGLDFMTIQLPSGRKLYYPYPFLAVNKYGKEAVFFKNMSQSTRKWEEDSTFGGKLAENVTQAIARDCLAESLMRLSHLGQSIVFHVHDEIVIEAPASTQEQGEHILKQVIEIMEQPITWAPGLVLKADGFVCRYYKKD